MRARHLETCVRGRDAATTTSMSGSRTEQGGQGAVREGRFQAVLKRDESHLGSIDLGWSIRWRYDLQPHEWATSCRRAPVGIPASPPSARPDPFSPVIGACSPSSRDECQNRRTRLSISDDETSRDCRDDRDGPSESTLLVEAQTESDPDQGGKDAGNDGVPDQVENLVHRSRPFTDRLRFIRPQAAFACLAMTCPDIGASIR